MSVTAGEQRARRPDRQVERRSGSELLQIHVAAELARLDRAAGAVDRRRRHPHDPEERRQLDLGAPGQRRDAALAVDAAVPGFADREVFGQGAGERPDPGVAPILPRLDRQDLDFEDVAGLGALDCDRPGQDVGAEFRLQRRVDRAVVGEDLEAAAGGQDIGPAGDAIHRHGVARGDRRNRLQRRIEEAPMAMLRPARQGVMLRHASPPATGLSRYRLLDRTTSARHPLSLPFCR